MKKKSISFFEIPTVRKKMGIKNLFSFLKKKCPEVFETRALNEITGKIVGIDANFFLYKFFYISPSPLTLFVNLIKCLWSKGIHVMFVFDGYNKVAKSKS